MLSTHSINALLQQDVELSNLEHDELLESTEVVIFHSDTTLAQAPQIYQSSSIAINNVIDNQHTQQSPTNRPDKISTKSALICCCLWCCTGTALGYWGCGLLGLTGSVAGLPGGWLGRTLCIDCDPDEEKEMKYTRLPSQQ